jgi:two-component system nitrogen regulation response regulator GlnG
VTVSATALGESVVSRRLLVVDDDPAIFRVLRAILVREGFEVMAAEDGEVGVSRALTDAPDLVILDLELPKLDGIQALERLKAERPGLPVIMLTGRNDVRSAVKAIQMGAFDYVTKPFDPDEISVSVRRAMETRALVTEVEDLRRQVRAGGADLDVQMGQSAAVRQIINQVQTVAATNFSVLVLGETGTGKELVAAALHRLSGRRGRPFVALDCGAIPEALLESELFGHEKGAFTGADRRRAGHFHLAEGGTLFLDEIGNLPVGLQAKLLRVLESRQLQAVGASQAKLIDVRFIAATNDDLQARAADGRFRSDLFFRLAQYTITLPPLRDRPDDIQHLAERFMHEVSVELRRPMQGISTDALDLLRACPWPGNVRQLRNVIRQAVLESNGMVLESTAVKRFLGSEAVVAVTSLPRLPGQSLKDVADQAAREAERQAINEALKAAQGNKSEAARALRTDFKTLHVKMKNLGIRARDFEI